MVNSELRKNKVFLRTFGCPIVQVPRDDFWDNKAGKWLVVSEI